MAEYSNLKDLSANLGVSASILKKHKDEIGYYRITDRSRIMMRYSDVHAWLERHKKQMQQDPIVREFLQGLVA